MAGSIQVYAKITTPRLAKVQSRHRLFQKLAGHNCPATWISSPAGSGKTVLAASYADHAGLDTLWYQVDGRDVDVSTIFYYMEIACRSAGITEDSQLPLLTPEYALGIANFTRNYFEQVFSHLKRPTLLVIDNFQDAGNAHHFREVVHEIISVAPTTVHVIIASRTDPPQLFTRLLTNNMLALVRWSELQFTGAEIEKYFSSSENIQLSQEQVQNLQKRTNGWVAGMQLIRMHAETSNIHQKHIDTHTPDQVFDYFMTELLNTTEETRRQFLLSIAPMPYLFPSIVEQLTGNQETEEIFATLHRENFFIEKHIGDIVSYQFHPIFQEFLNNCLHKEWSEEKINDIKNQSAELLHQAGYVEQAVELYTECKEYAQAADIILKHAPAMLDQGRYITLRTWIDSFPEQLFEASPWLNYWHGSCTIFTQPNIAAQMFAEAYRLFEEQENIPGKFFAISGVLNAIFYAFDSFGQADPWIKKVEELLEITDPPSQEMLSPLIDSILKITVLRNPGSTLYKRWEDKAVTYLHAEIALPCQDIMAIPLAWNALFSGDFTRTKTWIEYIRTRAIPSGTITYPMLLLHDAKLAFFISAADYKSFEQALEQAFVLESESGIYLVHTIFLSHATLGSLHTGDMQGAQDYLSRLDSHPVPKGRHQQSFINYIKAYYHYLSKNYSTAYSHIINSLTLLKKSGARVHLPQINMAIALILDALGKKEEAWHHLEHAISLCSTHQTQQDFFDCMLVRARFNFASDKRGLAVADLKEALRIGRENGYMTTWFWRPQEVALLCTQALIEGIETEYVTALVKKRELELDPPSLELENWPWPVKIYTMGQFSVLRDNAPLEFKGKKQKTPLNLLKIIIARGGREVPEEKITDILWPDSDGDAAHNAFSTTLYRLRKLVGNEKCILVSDGKVSLNQKYCSVDLWPFENRLNTALQLWQLAPRNDGGKEAAEVSWELIQSYPGSFLLAESEYWLFPTRDRIIKKMTSCLLSLGQYTLHMEDMVQAVQVYEKGLEINPLAEIVYQRLIQCYLKQGSVLEALITYKECKEELLRQLSVEPSPETKALIADM